VLRTDGGSEKEWKLFQKWPDPEFLGPVGREPGSFSMMARKKLPVFAV